MRSRRCVAGALAAAMLAWGAAGPALPEARAASDDSSNGAAIAAGLAIAVVAVYGLVVLKSDVEEYADAGTKGAIERAVAAAEESPVVLEALCGGAGGSGTPDGVAVGWRVGF
jgi:hypothetical protein